MLILTYELRMIVLDVQDLVASFGETVPSDYDEPHRQFLSGRRHAYHTPIKYTRTDYSRHYDTRAVYISIL